jgi:Zn-dependent protease with chaperone function
MTASWTPTLALVILQSATMNTPSSYRRLLAWLMAGYFPFLALVCVGAAGLAALCIGVAVSERGLAVLSIVLGILLGLTLIHLLTVLPELGKPEEEERPFEIELPDEFLVGLKELVEKVAGERRLPVAHAIRLSPETVAHVYEDKRGQRVLVVGCIALAGLSRQALTGVIAHELGHFGAGDTELSRAGARRFRILAHLENRFQRDPIAKWNPLIWLVRGYHRLFLVVWFAYSREAEYAADRQEVEMVGKLEAASTCILLDVLEEMPWCRLSSVARGYAMHRERPEDIFAEQVRRARVCDPSEWQDACRKTLKAKPRWFDTHPRLKDRLRALGVSSKKASQLALDLFQGGEPAHTLVPQWPRVQKVLSDRMMAMYQQYYWAMREVADLMIGGGGRRD